MGGKSSNPFAADSSPELLQQLGRAVLSYSMKRLGGQGKSSSPSKPSSAERSKSASRSKDRDKDAHDGYHEKDRDSSPHQSREHGSGATDKSESTDFHHILAQVAVGLFGYGIRQYLHHRKLSKRRAATAHQPRRRPGDPQIGSNQNVNRKTRERNEGLRNRGLAGHDGQSTREDQGSDPELAAALESITADLEETSKAIRKLAGRTPAHECDVHERLRNEADAIQGTLERVQTSVNNVRNLHGGLRTAKTMSPGAAELAQGDDGKRRERRQRGVSTASPEPRNRRRKRPRDHSMGRDWDGDERRTRGLHGDGGGGYRHSSRLYSSQDRDREEGRR